MWKYHCKKQLLIILVAFIIGAVMFHSSYDNVIPEIEKAYFETFKTAIAFPTGTYVSYLAAGFSVAALANAIVLFLALSKKYNIAIFLLVAIMFFFQLLVLLLSVVGAIILIPTIFVCIYGWVSIPNKKERSNLEAAKNNYVSDMERLFRLHYKFDDSVDGLVKGVWKMQILNNVMYGVAVTLFVIIMLYTTDLLLLGVAMLAYVFVLYYLMRRRAQVLQPIISLLYEKCDPIACASAIFSLTKLAHKRKQFYLPQHLAHCMIFLNDGNFAIDILTSCNKSNLAISYSIHTMSAYAYYIMGDKSMVQFHYSECEKLVGRGNKGLTMMREQALQSIQTKIDLMNQELDKVKNHYNDIVTGALYPFQQADAHYFIGLINFIEKNWQSAKQSFEVVSKLGNKMYYKAKSDEYLGLIEQMEMKSSEE